MNNGLFMSWLLLILGFNAIWVSFAKNLSQRLEQYHPSKFVRLGESSVTIGLYQLHNAYSLFKFMVTRQHTALNDRYISLLSDGFLVCITGFLVVWTICFNFVLNHL